MLLLGLGNTGAEYENTRHNVGFKLIDRLFEQLKLKPKETAEFVYADFMIGSEKHLLVKAKGYMNHSGLAAKALLQFNELQPSDMLALVDDFNLPLGRLRLRRGGSDGGHNGLDSIIQEVETDQFPRLRLGVGPLPENIDPAEFVLAEFEPDENNEVKKMIDDASQAVLFLIQNSLDEAMSVYNNNPA